MSCGHPRQRSAAVVPFVLLYALRVSITICDRYNIVAANQTCRETALSPLETDDNGNAMFQSYLSKLFKNETG